MKKKGYIIEHDYDGDSDNFERFLIKTPDGEIIRREIYAYQLDNVLKSLPDISGNTEMMPMPVADNPYGGNVHKNRPHYIYGREMKDHQYSNRDWRRWIFPKGIKTKIDDNTLYLVWFTHSEAADPADSSEQFYVYYIEQAPREIQEAKEQIQKLTKQLNDYQSRYLTE